MPTTAQLRTLGPAELTALLALRPEVTGPPAPRTLSELAARLSHPALLSEALTRINRPQLQVAEALAALRDGNRARLEQLLGVRDPGQRAALDQALAALAERWLLIPGTVRLDPALERGWPRALDLDIRVAELLPGLGVDLLRSSLASWGVTEVPPRKSALIAAMTRVLTDPERVRRVVSNAPAPMPTQLVEAAFGRRTFSRWALELAQVGQLRSTAQPVNWARQRLLLVTPSLNNQYSDRLMLPAEVALALRGSDWTAPFTPEPPPVSRRPVDPGTVHQAAVAAGGAAVRMVADLLRGLERRPITYLKNGLVGARELRRVGKEVGVPPEHVRLALAISHHCGLVDPEPTGIWLSAAGDDWRDLQPGPALAALLTGWMTLPFVPGAMTELRFAPYVVPAALEIRRAVLEVLAGGSGPATCPVADVVSAASWARPVPFGWGLNHHVDLPEEPVDDPDDEPDIGIGRPELLVRGVLAEAELLGITGAGGLSPAGRAALEGGDVAAAIGNALGEAHDEVVLQTDLTATVLGHPSAGLAELLDLAADRESRSAANVWRFGPASVRRALDTGTTVAELIEYLTAVGGSLPQTLQYLITDTGRRYGRLSTGAAGSYVVSEDVALLAEVAADRRLRRLELKLIAPTVLAAAVPQTELVAALRAAGHGIATPRPDQPAPAASTGHPPTEPSEPSLPSLPSLPALARALLSSPDQGNRLVDVGQTVIDVDSFEDFADL